MNAKATIARRISIGLLAVGATLVTTSCAAGQLAASSRETPAIDGVTGHLGSMQLHAVAITHPGGPCVLPGGDAALTFVLVNTSHSADSLTGVTSPRFASSAVVATADDLAAYEKADSGTGSCGSSPSGAATDSAAPSDQATAPAPEADATLPASGAQPTIAAGQGVPLGVYDASTNAPGVPTEPIIVLRGLQGQPLYPGTSIPVTFQFSDAGSITLQVPVQLSVAPNNSVIPTVTNAAD